MRIFKLLFWIFCWFPLYIADFLFIDELLTKDLTKHPIYVFVATSGGAMCGVVNALFLLGAWRILKTNELSL